MSATGFQRRRRLLEAEAAEAAGNVTATAPAPAPGPANEQAPAAGQAEKPLAEYTMKELRELAKDKGITLGGELTKKADIVAAIEKALGES